MRRRFMFLALLAALLVVTAGPVAAGPEASGPAAGSVAVHFSPGVRQQIVALLDGAEKSIDLAMYAFTDSDLAWAVVKALQRGVQVRVVLDAGWSANKYAKGEFLARRGIAVALDRGQGEKGIMHHKFAVIDGLRVLTGSFNWTASAEKGNDENLVVITDAGVAALYEAEFQRLWDEAQLIDPFTFGPALPQDDDAPVVSR